MGHESHSFSKLRMIASAAAILLLGAISGGAPAQAQDKPNILVIRGDDIGTWNISYNNRGVMGYQTPSIDRIASLGPRALSAA